MLTDEKRRHMFGVSDGKQGRDVDRALMARSAKAGVETAGMDAALERVLRPGQTIVLGQGEGLPTSVMRALPRHLAALRGSTIVVGLVPIDFPELPGTSIRTFFPSGPLGSRAGMTARNARYIRQSLYEFASGLRHGSVIPDVTILRTSLPREGRVSLGLNVDFGHAAAECADVLLLEVDSEACWTGASSSVAIDGRTVVVAAERPVENPGGDSAVERRPRSASDDRLSAHLAEVIPDGSHLQVGFGQWTSLVSDAVADLRQIHLQTGQIDQWVLPMLDAGSLNGDSRITATAVVPNDDVLRALRSVGPLELEPADVTHAPSAFARLPSFVAINSVFEVDLLGNVNCEFGPGDRLGGVGGLPDFAKGAHLHPRGLSVIALRAESRGASRIVPHLPPGRVSVPGDFVDAVVTDVGVAHVRGLGAEERAAALRAIAARHHRESLRAPDHNHRKEPHR